MMNETPEGPEKDEDTSKLEEEIATLATLIAQARELVSTGHTIDLAGLSDKVGAFCAAIAESVTAMIEALGHDYVRTARGKGLNERIVIWRHSVRNALIPSTTVLGLQLGTLLGGTLILEMIFGLPGLGRGVVQAAVERDYPVVLSVSVLLVLTMMVTNLSLDLLTTWLDPRLRVSQR